MMPVSKHGDPQLGVDIHLCVVPPSPSPVPLPTPHTSIVFDPFDYIPIIGATVSVCGMKRATAGTNGIAIHIPPGFPFAPKLPDKDDELFMGSSTVVADGDPFSFIALPVLSCQIAGMISPFRAKKKGGTKAMVLPTVFNLAIPTTVFVGGPPTISLMGLAFKGAFAALGKFAKSGIFTRIRQKLFKNLKPGFLKCAILRAEPVNILTGEVVVAQQDFALPGRIPIEWVRSYTSGSTRAGACGHGWETPADARLEVDPVDGTVTMWHPSAGPLVFDRLPVGIGEEKEELELLDGARLSDRSTELTVRTKEDLVYHFPKSLAAIDPAGTVEYPIGRIADLCGNWLDFERRDGHVVAIAESAGRRLEIVRVDDRIREIALTFPSVSDVRHVFVRYEYDAAGDLVSVVDPLGHPYRFAYDDHHLVQHTDRRGLTFYYAYDRTASTGRRVEHAWGDDGLYDYQFAYDDVLRQRRITDSLGEVWLVQLDERGLPISELDPLGGTTVFEYDESARTTAVIDQAGLRTEFTYDARGNQLALARPDGSCVTAEFDAADKPVTVTDANGGRWEQHWDERGLLRRQTTPLGNVLQYDYDGHGQLVAFVDARGGRTAFGVDALGNAVVLADALGHATRFSYDILGNVLSATDPLGATTHYRYDAKGRLTLMQRPSAATVQCAYDPEDNLIGHIDENGAETRLEYVGLGELHRRIQPDGHVVEYDYDTEERLIAITNQRGERYELSRDALGRVVAEVDYWGQVRRHGYAANGHVRFSIDPLGRRVIFDTDALGRVVRKTMPGGAVETIAYDGIGKILEAASGDGVVTRVFDGEGRLLQEQQGSFTITNAYDANGNRVRRTTTLGNTVDYEYDASDQVVAIRVNDGAVTRVERDPSGRVTREALANGLSRHLHYDVDGAVTAKAIVDGDTPLIVNGYGYDPAGNLIRRDDSVWGTDRFAYDPVGRVIRHLDPAGRITEYLNDPAGDRLRTRIVERALVRVVGEGPLPVEWSREGEYEGTFYRFDRAGNVVERADADRHLHLRWDASQRLVESESEGVLTRYGYDAFGRRLFKQTGSRRTDFYWDGDALAGERTTELRASASVDRTGSEQVVDIAAERARRAVASPRTKEFVYYPTTFEPLCLLVDDGRGQEVYQYQTEPNGCPTRLLDAAGRVRWSATVTAWGVVAADDGAAELNPLRLEGQYWDDETGLTYNRNRYFDPVIGQFLSLDPLGIDPSENPYEFADNALGWVDPLGLKCTRLVNENGKLILEIVDKFKPGSRESRQLRRFVKAWGEEIAANGGSMTRRSLTAAEEKASAIWKKQMRKKYPARFRNKVVGHTPDASMGGRVAGGRATALSTPVNSYLGGAAGGVPAGTTYHGVRVVR